RGRKRRCLGVCRFHGGLNFAGQVSDSEGVRPLTRRWQLRSLMTQGTERVADTGKNPFIAHPVVWKLEARLFQRNETAGEIATVNDRNVVRPKRLECFRVVPIEKVPTKLL